MLHILGVGYSHPRNVIDNQFILSLGVDTTAEWIMDKIGIETRRTTLPLEYIRETRNQDPLRAFEVAELTTTDLGVAAAKAALERAGVKADSVGLVICDCLTPQYSGPSEAVRIAAGLNIGAKALDVLTACPAFALHMDFLRGYREDLLPDYILCVCTGAVTQRVNYNDRTDGAIWGDGAAAWVVSPRHEGRLAVLDSVFTADPSRAHAVVVDRFGFFHQDGRAVRDFSVRQTVRLIKDIENRHEIDWSRDVFIGHQANAKMLRQITNNREISERNHWHNAEYLGNQAGAGAPVVLGEHWEEITPGQKILIAVVGAGLSWGSVLMEARS